MCGDFLNLIIACHCRRTQKTIIFYVFCSQCNAAFRCFAGFGFFCNYQSSPELPPNRPGFARNLTGFQVIWDDSRSRAQCRNKFWHLNPLVYMAGARRTVAVNAKTRSVSCQHSHLPHELTCLSARCTACRMGDEVG